jgi:hypothetical protein
MPRVQVQLPIMKIDPRSRDVCNAKAWVMANERSAADGAESLRRTACATWSCEAVHISMDAKILDKPRMRDIGVGFQ